MAASVEPQAGREPKAAQEFTRRHRPPSGALQFHDADGAFLARDREAIVEQCAGCAAALRFRRAQDFDPDRLAVERKLEPGAREWRKPPDMVVHFTPRPPPIDASLG